MNILRLANYHVRGAGSGKEALSLLENGIPFELVILDLMMPEISGSEVLEALRKKYTRLELPVLMLTSKSQTEDMSVCFKLGANDYLPKPFEADELLARVNSLVKLKKAVNKLVSTEMSFLQAQIKPQLIQNALSVISSLSIKDPHKAKALILDLSDFLRGSFGLNNGKGLTTLSRELELVKAYLSIEQARFKERLQVQYHIQEDVDCTLPLLTVQPLVENAIRHGIMCDNILKWKRHKSSENFAYLLHQQGVPIHKEKLCEMMWPEYDPQKALTYLQTIMYQLRKNISEIGGGSISIEYADHCYRLILNNVRYDVELFKWASLDIYKNQYI